MAGKIKELREENARLKMENEALRAPEPGTFVTGKAAEPAGPAPEPPQLQAYDGTAGAQATLKTNEESGLGLRAQAQTGRPPTRPWNGKDLTYRPFRRDYFNINKNTAWHERFVTPENVEVFLVRGYEVAPASEYKLVDKIIDDGKPLASHITRRGMVLMRKRRGLYEEEQCDKDELLKQKRMSYKRQVQDEAKRVEAEMGGGHRVVLDDDEK